MDTFKITSEEAETRSEEPSVIQNSVGYTELNLTVSWKVKKFLSGNFIFSWPDAMKYLSDLDEKWMVREGNICSFWAV